jgi:hypothetical protein
MWSILLSLILSGQINVLEAESFAKEKENQIITEQAIY